MTVMSQIVLEFSGHFLMNQDISSEKRHSITINSRFWLFINNYSFLHIKYKENEMSCIFSLVLMMRVPQIQVPRLQKVGLISFLTLN